MLPFWSNIYAVPLIMVPSLDEHLLSMWSFMCITMLIVTYVNVCVGACVYRLVASFSPPYPPSPWPSCARLTNIYSRYGHLCVSHIHRSLLSFCKQEIKSSSYKYCGWLYFRGYQFSWIVFLFIIHTEICLFVGTGIRGSDPPRKPRKLVPNEN